MSVYSRGTPRPEAETFKPSFQARRFYDCVFYPECLTKAAHAIAPSLPCQGCPRYQKDREPLDPMTYGGILKLLQEVFQPQE
jgi:hypothetical protein